MEIRRYSAPDVRKVGSDGSRTSFITTSYAILWTSSSPWPMHVGGPVTGGDAPRTDLADGAFDPSEPPIRSDRGPTAGRPGRGPGPRPPAGRRRRGVGRVAAGPVGRRPGRGAAPAGSHPSAGSTAADPRMRWHHAAPVRPARPRRQPGSDGLKSTTRAQVPRPHRKRTRSAQPQSRSGRPAQRSPLLAVESTTRAHAPNQCRGERP